MDLVLLAFLIYLAPRNLILVIVNIVIVFIRRAVLVTGFGHIYSLFFLSYLLFLGLDVELRVA